MAARAPFWAGVDTLDLAGMTAADKQLVREMAARLRKLREMERRRDKPRVVA